MERPYAADRDRRAADTRAMVGVEALLTNLGSTQLPRPLVKWSYEPSIALDVPLAMSRALHMAALPPSGPIYLSVPYDDRAAEADPQSSALLDRQVYAVGSFDGPSLSGVVERLNAANNPVLSSDRRSTRVAPMLVRFV